MFKKITVEEQLRQERAKNASLLLKNKELEDAVIELASIITGGEDGKDILQQDNQ